MPNEERNSNIAYVDKPNFSSFLPNVVVSVVNPQGTVTTVTNNTMQQNESSTTEIFIHENFDETLFRPVIMGDLHQQAIPNYELGADNASEVVDMPLELIVPVIDETLLQQKRKEHGDEKTITKTEFVEAEKNMQKYNSQPLKAIERSQGSQCYQKRKKGLKNKKNDEKKTQQENLLFDEKSNESFIKPMSSGEKSLPDKVAQETRFSNSLKEQSNEKPLTQELAIKLAVEALSDEKKLESKTAESISKQQGLETLETSKRGQQELTFPKTLPNEVSCRKEKASMDPKVVEKTIETFGEKGKEENKCDNFAKHDTVRTEMEDDFLSLIGQNQSEKNAVGTTPLEDIRQPLFVENVNEITSHDCLAEDDAHSDPDANLIDESLIYSQDFSRDAQHEFIKNEDFYDIDEDLPPLEPLELFEPFNSPLKSESQCESVCPKQEMKQKMSELLKDTNIVFAMCSSLKEMKDDSDVMSSSSQIQRSTSSSLRTNTTTATFASANSNASLEVQDIDDSSPVEQFASSDLKTLDIEKPSAEEGEETSGFETTSSETEESSKKLNIIESSFTREHDEELRPLLESSIISLSPSASSSAAMDAIETINILALPETNQKLPSTQPASNSNSGNKRKNKKKRK